MSARLFCESGQLRRNGSQCPATFVFASAQVCSAASSEARARKAIEWLQAPVNAALRCVDNLLGNDCSAACSERAPRRRADQAQPWLHFWVVRRQLKVHLHRVTFHLNTRQLHRASYVASGCPHIRWRVCAVARLGLPQGAQNTDFVLGKHESVCIYRFQRLHRIVASLMSTQWRA